VYSSNIVADAYKFTYFSLAALELCRALGWTPDIIHANDWHTSPALYSLALRRPNDPWFQTTAGLLTLHNLPYMGGGAEGALWEFGLPPATDERLPWWARHQPLPLGLLSADHIVAASPGYAQEVLTPEFGSGLEGFLQSRQSALSGILNGLHTERWDPATDAAIPARYTAASLETRRENKAALLREMSLDDDLDAPLFSVVTRMDPQKGIDLIPAALRQIHDLPWKIIILGSGIPEIEDMCRWLEFEFPGRVRTAIRYDAALSRRMYAAADMLLVPSRYEPCGLTQMIAMRYGCVPIARATGGLRDTIKDYDQAAGSTGFVFAEASSNALAARLRRALAVYRDKPAWRALQQRGMAEDFSWGHFAQEYIQIYQRLALAAPIPEYTETSPL
jgi:starch synthase